MGFFDKVKEIISENDDDDFDEYYDDAEASFEKSSKSERSREREENENVMVMERKPQHPTTSN